MVADSWGRWELPMLRAIAEELDAQPYGSNLSVQTFLEKLDPGGVDTDHWGRAIDRLEAHGYIEAGRAMWGRPYPFSIDGLTERGLRTVGAWPNDETSIQLLVGVMVAAAAEVEPYSPEEATRMREVGRFLERQLQTGISGLTSGLGAAIGKVLTGG